MKMIPAIIILPALACFLFGAPFGIRAAEIGMVIFLVTAIISIIDSVSKMGKGTV